MPKNILKESATETPNPCYPIHPAPANNKWLFEVVFRLWRICEVVPILQINRSQLQNGIKDPILSPAYNPGFELRTYRLCKRLLTYHHFDELATTASLTGIFECAFNESEAGTTLQSVAYIGVRRDLRHRKLYRKNTTPVTF